MANHVCDGLDHGEEYRAARLFVRPALGHRLHPAFGGFTVEIAEEHLRVTARGTLTQEERNQEAAAAAQAPSAAATTTTAAAAAAAAAARRVGHVAKNVVDAELKERRHSLRDKPEIYPR